MKRKEYPILEFPGHGPAIIEPQRLYAKKPRIPARCVLCFFHEAIEALRESGRLKPLTSLPGEGQPIVVYQLKDENQPPALASGKRPEPPASSLQPPASPHVCLAFPGIGAPFAAGTLEEVIALGARAIICVGGAGVLDSSIPVGRVMIPTRALRDEGTSYHYQSRGRFSRPDAAAVRAIREACAARSEPALPVTTWTTDGVYRETREVILERMKEGCHAVEMETAAFFAVAKFRKVSFAQILYAGDDVSGEKWNHRGWLQQSETRQSLLELAFDAVRRVPL